MSIWEDAKDAQEKALRQNPPRFWCPKCGQFSELGDIYKNRVVCLECKASLIGVVMIEPTPPPTGQSKI